MILLLIYTALVTPFAIALLDIERIEWFIIDTLIDMAFFADIVIICCLAYYDEDNNLIVKRSTIF